MSRGSARGGPAPAPGPGDASAGLRPAAAPAAGGRPRPSGPGRAPGRTPAAGRPPPRTHHSYAEPAVQVGSDDLGDPHGELLVDHDDLATGHQGAVDEQVDGAAGG